MRRVWVLAAGSVTLSACMTTRPVILPGAAPAPWEQRLATLQQAAAWKLDGRAAVAVGTQGWQASLEFQERGTDSELHLAGPFGVGALVLKRTSQGLSLNGAPPGDEVVGQIEDRLGFDLPLDELRYWVLGVPAPGAPFELARDAQDRARQLAQAGWSVSYEKYVPVGADLLPARVVLSRDTVRVRIVVDHWTGL